MNASLDSSVFSASVNGKNKPHLFEGAGVKPDSGSGNWGACKFPRGTWSIYRKKSIIYKFVR